MSDSEMNEKEPKSPCVSICVLDDDDVCAGCFRTADEITDWTMSTADKKRLILKRAHERREASNPIRLL
jgi:predicted Fe-S protein YdhL (DUF1289 family)